MRYNPTFTIIICFLILFFSFYTKKEIYAVKYISDITIFKSINKKNINLPITYKNEILNENIKTVLCHKKEQQLSLSIINIESNDKLLISFDDLDGDIKNYAYTIIHCNSDWSKSNLMQNEYIQGFNKEYISSYEFSFNTIQKYTHYEFEFPSKNMRPTLSGNYIFKIYEEETGKTIIYKRFMVLDPQIYIEANVRRATLVENRNTQHEIDFIIKHPNFIIADPYSDIKVHIKQNNREDNVIRNLKPQFIRNDELIYDYEDGNTFWGNNEFRHFDFRSLRYQSERIKNIDFDSIYNYVYLFNDKERAFEHYSIEQDINGKFIIESQEAWDSSVESDYAFVNFKLSLNEITYGDLYLLGKFSDWELKDEFKLSYNRKRKLYEGHLYLKQGYYNYHYAIKDTTKGRVNVNLIEGTHYETRNDYYIYVYYRSVSDRYDRLIGFLKTSSKTLF